MSFIFVTTVFLLSCFIGCLVVSGVTPALHAPLMSVSNAISGIVIIGALETAASAQTFSTAEILSLTAVFLASLNIFGGFTVSARMLKLFKRRDEK